MRLIEMDVTTTTLEQRDPARLRPGRPLPDGARFELAGHATPEYVRWLYATVGGPWRWSDRLAWDRQRWADELARPGSEVHVLTVDGTPAGYAQLAARPDASDASDASDESAAPTGPEAPGGPSAPGTPAGTSAPGAPESTARTPESPARSSDPGAPDAPSASAGPGASDASAGLTEGRERNAPGRGTAVEVLYFGLAEWAIGRGLGGAMLTEALRAAWSLADRHDLPAVTRVWLHTCDLDGPQALANYTARGLEVIDVSTKPERAPTAPIGAWAASTTFDPFGVAGEDPDSGAPRVTA